MFLLLSQVPLLPSGVNPLYVDAGSYPTQSQFATSVFNGFSDHDFEDTVICASFMATTVVGYPLPLQLSGPAADRVLCPAGSFATGGGMGLVGLNRTASSGPVLDNGSPDGVRLISAADGVGAVPIGWYASAYNPPNENNVYGRVAAVCIPSRVFTAVASVTVPALSSDSRGVLCPPGNVAYGGGVDVNDPLTMSLRSSSPLFDDGTATGQRLMARPAGPDAAPIGWFGAVSNNAVAGFLTLKVAAICPEPVAGEVEIAALGALLATWRTRRKRG